VSGVGVERARRVYDFQVEMFDPRGHAVECVIRAQDLIDLNSGNADVVAVLDALAEEPNENFDLDRCVVSRVACKERP
jgi:hypothetical protein